MSLVEERVRQLNSELEALFQRKNLQLECVYEHVRNHSSASTASREHLSVAVEVPSVESRGRVLRDAILSVRLDRGNLLGTGGMLATLKHVEEIVHGSWKNIPDDQTIHQRESDAQERQQLEEGLRLLEWLFVAKIEVAVYANVLNTVLNVTLPLSDDIYYWQEFEGSSLRTVGHLLQTSPARMCSLSASLFNSACQMYHDRSRRQSPFWRDILTTQNYLHLFPTYLRKSLVGLPSLGLLSLMRYEFHYKISKLKALLEVHATCLGVLIQEYPCFLKQDEDDVIGVIDKHVTYSLALMERILSALRMVNHEEKSTLNASEIIGRKATVPPRSLRSIYTCLRQIMEVQLPTVTKQAHEVIAVYGQPNALTRWWLPATAGLVLGYNAIGYIQGHGANIMMWLDYVHETLMHFWTDWVWQPVIQMLETIRHREQSLALMSKESVKLDLESLERMVVDFASEYQHLSDEERIDLQRRLHNGDLSIVMRAYESEMKRPITSAVRGDLIRAFLIQIQKAKIDLELSMAALDKLLKSNELNFAFLAVGPSLFVIYLLSSWLRKKLWEQSEWAGKTKGTYMKIRETLRQVERLLVQDYPSWESPDPRTSQYLSTLGLVLCKAHLLRMYAKDLPTHNNVRERFLEDLRDLEDLRFNFRQKILTCERMWRCWGFLKKGD